MPSQPHQPLSESTLLTRYLLLPSSLPTILPYNTFLTLLPTSARNNADLQPHLRRLYTDLQSQRTIDLETVRHNIARECARAGTVKAQLRRDLARELDGGGDRYDNDGNLNGGAGQDTESYYIDMKREASMELAPSRKRKRRGDADSDDDDEDEDQEMDGSEASHDDDDENNEDLDDEDREENEIPESPHASAAGTKTHSSPSSSSIPSPAPPAAAAITTSAQTARLDALLDISFHGTRGLALPSSFFAAGSAPPQHHSKASLLKAMEAAVAALRQEVGALQSERERVAGEVRETVGGLSDLRYGSFGGRGSGGGGGGAGLDGGVEGEVQRGLGLLREVVQRKVRDL